MNQTSLYDLCILVPIYNEQENMYRLEKELTGYLQESSVNACILFVNDGSTDSSLSLIREICGRNASFFYLSLACNRGLSGALKAGIDVTRAEWVGYIDADLQTAPGDFELLLPYRNTHTMVMGIRTNRKDSIVKNISSRIANGFRRRMTGDDAQDTGCPLKIMRTDAARKIPLFNGMHRFFPALIQLQEGTVKQVPVRHFKRMAGTSKYHFFNRLTGPFMDCFGFRWMKKRYINYQVNEQNLANRF
ncbi:MAG: glycosyltransferase [Tannerellaceae bacterium]|nr:glycosyltransferase [Tannerellaceae bacterium]